MCSKICEPRNMPVTEIETGLVMTARMRHSVIILLLQAFLPADYSLARYIVGVPFVGNKIDDQVS